MTRLLPVIAPAILLVAGCTHLTDGTPRTQDGLPLVVNETFDQPCPERWEPMDPKAWEFTTDGDRTIYSLTRKAIYKPPHRSPEGISILKDVVVSDFVYDAYVRSTGKNYEHRDLCFVFGWQGPARYYYVHLGQNSDQTSNTIHIVNDKPRTSIVKTRTTGTPWTDDYHHVRIVRDVTSGAITVHFDDMTKPWMTANDTTFKSGRIGFGSFDDTGNVDRIVLWGRQE